MGYDKLFDPSRSDRPPLERPAGRLGDLGPEQGYVYEDKDERIVLAVNIAIATGRPLLIGGEPGTGKSSLAADVARRLGWRFYSKTISSRTQARDLLWTFDTIRRLSDAETKSGVRHPSAYVEPGVLWWAFERASATRRGLAADQFARLGTAPPGQSPEVEAASYPLKDHEQAEGAVVLLDEIDKADPDVPNDLLEPLGSLRFRVIEGSLDYLVEAAHPPLVFITTNNERDLPRAFLRRCVSLTLEPPEKPRLLKIAAAHFPDDDAALHDEIATAYFEIRKQYAARDVPPPSTAEFLDAVSACSQLNLKPGTPQWADRWPQIADATLGKRRDA